jgi:group I intron endonuclease
MPKVERPRPPTDVLTHGRCPEPGIYVIENAVSGEWYIGSAQNMRKRWQTHRSLLRAGNHHAVRLQASWGKYGEGAFRFIPLQVVPDKARRLLLEQHFLNTLTPPLNTSSNAHSCEGVKRSTETVAKIRVAVTAPERLLRLKAMAKRPKSAEHRARIAESRRGQRPSEETRAKLRAASARRWGRTDAKSR